MKLIQDINFRHFRGDLTGGITSAIVALPLALAFGVASGAGAIVGLYGAIATGFFAALFGGTNTQISGPTGPMTVVMTTMFARYISADPETGLATAFTVVVLAGVFQILLGLFRLGKYIILVPYAVISGFMSGIGIIIIIIQLGPLLGHESGGSVMEMLLQLPQSIAGFNSSALTLGIVTLVIVFLWPRVWNRILPSPLAALIVGTLSFLLIFPGSEVATIGEVSAKTISLNLPYFRFELLSDMLQNALLLAVLGAIDSLLTSLVADNITRSHHDSDRELIGQGIGNVVAGFVGGLAGAGATMRTVVNIRSGGTTAMSGMIHAIVLLIIILGAAPLAENIPHAVLAGILIKVGIDIIDREFLKRFFRLPRFTQLLMAGVLLLTVFVNLITAVVVGVFVVNIVTIDRLTNLQLDNLRISTGEDEDEDQFFGEPRELDVLKKAGGKILLFHLDGPLSYGVARSVHRQLSSHHLHEILVLDLTGASLVGISTSIALERIILDEKANGREVFLAGISAKAERDLSRLDILSKLAEGSIFPQRLDALNEASARISAQ